MAMVARRTLYFSMSSDTLDRRRIPAVSMKTKLPLSFSKRESMASRVVPATSETMTRSSPRIRFTREDTEQDTKVAGLAHEAGKASIVVVNKWDLIEKDGKTMDEYRKKLEQDG